MKVNDMGFWNLIKDQAGQEAYEFLSVAGGYYSNTINWNAAEAFPYMVGDFSSPNTTYKTIDGGYDLIAYALASRFLDQPGTGIWTTNRLVGFDKTSESCSPRYRLTFFNRSSRRYWTVLAQKLILAMPRRSLELLDQCNFLFKGPDQNTLQQGVGSVIIEPSFKLLMGFEEPWWKNFFQTAAGASVTDLPIRQCYYFGTDREDSHALFLASYNDMRTVEFWQPLEQRIREPFEPRATSRVSIDELTPLLGVQATKAVSYTHLTLPTICSV